MKDQNYWKRYPVLTNPEEIGLALSSDYFLSEGKRFELLRFYKDTSAGNVLISPGSGGHAYVFAELAYLIHKQGYNVFIMPRHGGFTISELFRRHTDAIQYIRSKYPNALHLYGEGLGGLVIFYLALAGVPVQSIICENAPAILTDKAFHNAMKKDGKGGKRRALLLPLFRLLVKVFPSLPIPIKAYLVWEELIDFADEHNRAIEERIVQGYNNDPDFDKRYPLQAVMSLVNTPPPNPLSDLSIPIMFIVTTRGFMPAYFKELFRRLPMMTKRLVEIDGGVFWMVSNPNDAAKLICDWIARPRKEKELFTHSIVNHENN
ncbi:MAG TPA: hypothetical protein VGC29_07240 [Flavisolibacter sp.]